MSKYKGNHAGLRELLNTQFLVDEMERRAKLGKAYAESVAPVFTGKHSIPGSYPGRYKESFSTSKGRNGGWKHNRAYGRLENDAPEAFWVEWGNKNVERHRVLGNALDVMHRG